MAIQWFDGFKNFNQAQILGRLGIAQDGSLTVDGNLVSNGSGGNIIVFNTLTDLQTAYPNGTNVPVWVISDSCWYYWTGTVTTDTTPPVDVTGLTIGTVTTTSIPIAWTKSTSSDVANYEVAYSSNGGSTWVVSNKVNSSSTSYTISGLTASTNYTVRVVAIDTSSNRSTGVTTTTTTSVPDTTPPLDVTNLVASAVTSTSLTLSWVASTSTDVSEYDVYNGTSLLTGTAFTNWAVGQLSPNTSYTFKVVAKDTSGNASNGVSLTVTTAASGTDITPPTVTISPVAGSYTSTQSVTLSANETATIYYTLDGSTPTTSSSVYNSPILVSATTIINYFAKDTSGNSSTVQSVTYTISAVSSWVTNGLIQKWDNVTTALSVTDTGFVPPNGDFTICTTFIPKVYMNLFVQGSPNTINLRVDGSNSAIVDLNIYPNDSTFPIINTSAVMTDNTQYYHYVLVRDSVGYHTYVNNVANTSLANTKTLNDSSSNISLGTSGGNIKTLVYYNRALSTAELTQNYNALK